MSSKLASEITPTQLVVVCGNNQEMVSDLSSPTRRWPRGVTVHVKGFIQNVHEFMGASNLLVTKAGPGTIAEAMILGLPLVLSTFLPGQEEGNVPYVVDNGFGLFSGEDAHAIADSVAELLNDENRLVNMSNRAKELSLPGATLAIARDLATLCLQSKNDINENKGVEMI